MTTKKLGCIFAQNKSFILLDDEAIALIYLGLMALSEKDLPPLTPTIDSVKDQAEALMNQFENVIDGMGSTFGNKEELLSHIRELPDF
jgi:hypothetical protein